MKTLDVPGIALTGQQLIEASAGTGKTHAIANLFLRLILERRLRADQVLVVTFTNAATDELRARIRQRLAAALQLLETPASIASEGDVAFRTLLERAHGTPDREKLLRHLRAQLSAMDDAAVFTIHGFCQRVLAESAFESGEPFTAELSMETGLLLQRAVTDWWRRRFYADPLLARLAAGHPQLCSPAALLGCIAPLMARDLRIDFDHGDPSRHSALAKQVRTAWLADGGKLVTEIRQLTGNGMLSKSENTLRDDCVDLAVGAMAAFCADEAAAVPATIARRFGQAFLDDCLSAKAKKSGTGAPTFAVSALLDRLFASEGSLAQSLIAEAIDFCRTETDRLKRRDAVLGFDDLIRRLHDALEAAGGEALAQRLAMRYPAALVDECQDTDPAQYAIFRRIYMRRSDSDSPDNNSARHDTCLLMIGDPKQAIYSFRGADVFAYLGAKRATANDAQHTLGTNWRSVRPLVDGVNALFGRLGDQSFLYPNAIGFAAVDAADRAERKPLRVNGQIPVPLLFDVAPPPPEEKKNGLYNKEEFQELAATATVARIAALLTAAGQGHAMLGDRKLELRDIAVLVRTHREGALIQNALRDAGIGSAIASQQSVFASNEAAALQQVLAAIADPASDRLLRRALVSDIWHTDALEIERLRTDESAADALRNRIAGYHAIWLKQGFMPMFRRWLHGERIPARLWDGSDGERAMTNLLQLAELLQSASREFPAPDALLKHLAATRAAGRTAEEHQLRLESDENLVQIITLHKSKGLQYPVVFLPFLACGHRPDGAPPTLWHDDEGALVCTLRDDPPAQAHHDHEQLAEDLRLAYVALTRAQYQCVVGWGAVNNGEQSALAWLLMGEPPAAGDLAAWRQTVRAKKHEARCAPVQALVTAHADAIAVETMPAQVHRLAVPARETAHWRAREIPRPVPQLWRQTSYSSLAQSVDDGNWHGFGDAREDAVTDASTEIGTSTPGADDIASFPRGRQTGHFFHTLIENLDFPSAHGDALHAQIERQLARHGLAAHWRDIIGKTVGNVLDTPLGNDGFTLRTLSREQRCDECEFFFPLTNLQPDRLAPLLPILGDDGHHRDRRDTVRRLDFTPVSGLLRGFIDLVFVHAGRWYLADWKTNWLGPTTAHYRLPALHAAMRDHHYDLQYSLYSVALHRHLATRVPGYDVAQHFGGVYYFFVRGMHPANGVDTGVFFRRAGAAEILALDAVMDDREPT